MTTSRDPDGLIRAFIREGDEDLHDQVYDAVRAAIEQKRQRAFIGPWRAPLMNKFVTFGVGAAAVVVLLFVGVQLLSAPSGDVGGPGDPTPTPQPTATPASAAPDPSASDGSLPEGPFLVFDPATQPAPFDQGVAVTVTIPGSGWTAEPQFGALSKGEQIDPPEGEGAALLTGDTGAPGLFVYGDPCHWQSTTPEAPATTVDDIVAALAAQTSRDATTPTDVTIGGYAGKSVTLHVPDTATTRAEAFEDCDENTFATYNVEGLEGPTRYQQGPGQIDEFWILDVDGVLVILNATYGPATPADLVAELRSIVESATFETP